MRGMPSRYREKTFATFDPAVSGAAGAAFGAANHVIDGRSSLVLVGRPGAGKSHLAAAIGNSQRGGEWCNVPELVHTARQDIHTGDNDAAKWLHDLATEDGFVVLDDLGREKVSEWTGELIYVLVNRRYEDNRPTVVTSNLTMAELESNGYGPVLSRLSEEGRLVEMATATDYRTRRP